MGGSGLTERTQPPLEVWAGFECTRVRVRGRSIDQVELTGHGSRAEDLQLLPWLGAKAVRYPVLWERIARRGLDTADWQWTDERLEILRQKGIRPVVGLLHHGGGPRGMSMTNPAFPQAFARFARGVAQRYPWIDTYLPINEPLTTARFAGLYGFWHPHAKSEATFAKLLVAQALAIRMAITAIREVRPDARLIVNEDMGRTFATPELAHVANFANSRRWLTWDLLMGHVRKGHPMWNALAVDGEARANLVDLASKPSPPDVLGVDHYITSDRYLDHRVDLFPSELRPRRNQPAYVDVEAVRVAGMPENGVARAIADTWERYGRPLALTEVALAGDPADQAAWWSEAWFAAQEASMRGVDIRAVTAWAVVGATGWDALLCRRTGRYEPGYFDTRTMPARARPAAHAVRAAAALADRVAPPEVSANPGRRQRTGWWRRSDRFLWEGGTEAA